MTLVESKHDVSETFNNYLENAQSSVKGSVSPVSITVQFKYIIGLNNVHKSIKLQIKHKKGV